ncbi:MAG: hypothetical protein IJS65_01835 [Clostridia bacterium]|nr:hypothetical protein [Clostridia bacterium]
MKVRFNDGLVREMSESEYEKAKKEAELLMIAAVKNGYTREEAEEAYGLKIEE